MIRRPPGGDDWDFSDQPWWLTRGRRRRRPESEDEEPAAETPPAEALPADSPEAEAPEAEVADAEAPQDEKAGDREVGNPVPEAPAAAPPKEETDVNPEPPEPPRAPPEDEISSMARKKQAKKTRAAGAARPAPARKATRKVAKKAAPKTVRKTVKKAGGRTRKASGTKAPSEATVSVRQRAFREQGVEEQPELPLEAGLPPGVSSKEPLRATAGMERKSGKSQDLTVTAIERTAQNIYGRILKGDKPELKSPIRSLGNVTYRKAVGYFEIGRQKKIRTLTVNTVRTFAQSLRMMSLSKEMVHADTFATKRDAYYQSKNWEDARFNDQAESDTVMDDIEAMFSLEGVTREQLRFYPEEHGGAVAGELVVVDRDPVTGGVVEIDCTRFGSGAYTIPHSVEHLKFKTKAKFVLAIETGGMFQRLQYHAYPSKAKCIIISMGGVPTRACRRFIRRLSDDAKIPVYAFVDCDPYGISNIYRSLKVGSGNAAHINKFFCVPKARFLGVTPDDIIKYKLPTHPLKDVDVSRAKDALKNDPFFHAHKPWTKALQQLLKMGVRAEQQALAKWGLNYVMDEYLPAKLKDTKSFLP